MKGGQKPIHIQRWAPSDFVNDPAVRLALSERNFIGFTFYVLVLNHSFMEGGDLPANVAALAAVIGMSRKDVEEAMPYWMEQNKLVIEETCLFNRRVRDEVVSELAYRRKQRRSGRNGGKARVALGKFKGSLRKDSSPPAPTPAPSPAPSPAPAPPSWDEADQVRDELDRTIRETATLTGRHYDEILFEVSTTPSGKRIDNLPACTSVQWMRVALRKTVGILMAAKVKNRGHSNYPTETPEERALRRLKTGTDE